MLKFWIGVARLEPSKRPAYTYIRKVNHANMVSGLQVCSFEWWQCYSVVR